MCLLWVYDFRPAIDQVTGQPINPDLEDYTGVRSSPYHSKSAFSEHLVLTRTSRLLPTYFVANRSSITSVCSCC
ncbi:hypothetical protein OG21DRAFT_1517215 [Imleria badia]|nr:hypothetical protein OG21DRAFT_1517215 [Imleria badia]